MCEWTHPSGYVWTFTVFQTGCSIYHVPRSQLPLFSLMMWTSLRKCKPVELKTPGCFWQALGGVTVNAAHICDGNSSMICPHACLRCISVSGWCTGSAILPLPAGKHLSEGFPISTQFPSDNTEIFQQLLDGIVWMFVIRVPLMRTPDFNDYHKFLLVSL